MNRNEALRRITGSPKFDAAWYRNRHPEVGLSGLTPEEHLLAVGGIVSRDPGPNFDTSFYRETYDIQHPSNHPFLDYLTAEDQGQRPTTRAQLAAQMNEVERASSRAWGALDPGIALSYCIPIMNRLGDIEQTLKYNLEENEIYRGRIEFLVAIFDRDDESENWIRTHFEEALEDGYLRLIRDTQTLDTWHFGKAKNAFRRHLRGKLFSSLDGDNYVTAAETQLLFDLARARPEGFIFHHFTGNWGDGTSGRVTVPTSIYRTIGYDPTLLPRQFDEIDLIFGALKRFPALPFICVDPDENAISLSSNAQVFWSNERLPNRRFHISYPDRHLPFFQRGQDYAKLVPYLDDMNNFNATLSAFRRAPDSRFRDNYLRRNQYHKFRFLDTLPSDKAVEILFETPEPDTALPTLRDDDIPLFCCVRNESVFLPKFVAHYRGLGVTRFFFVDDHSDTPLSEMDLGEGVFAVRPKVGDFKTSKTLWLEGLMRALLWEGAWVVVADADEFLHLPAPFDTLRDLIDDLTAAGRDTCPGLLLDLVPDPNRPVPEGAAFDDIVDQFCLRDDEVDPDYSALAPVRWAFGSHSDVSWRVDSRYHVFGTIDSLRKFPLFRLRHGIHLNQGFHALQANGQPDRPDPEIWAQGPILPIFHYKLARLFSADMRRKMLQASGGYFGRTERNIGRIFGESADSISPERFKELAPWLRPATDARTPGIFDPR